MLDRRLQKLLLLPLSEQRRLSGTGEHCQLWMNVVDV